MLLAGYAMPLTFSKATRLAARTRHQQWLLTSVHPLLAAVEQARGEASAVVQAVRQARDAGAPWAHLFDLQGDALSLQAEHFYPPGTSIRSMS